MHQQRSHQRQLYPQHSHGKHRLPHGNSTFEKTTRICLLLVLILSGSLGYSKRTLSASKQMYQVNNVILSENKHPKTKPLRHHLLFEFRLIYVIFMFFLVISYLRCYTNFDIFFYPYNFNIFVYSYPIHVIFCIVSYFLFFNYFFCIV